MDSVAGSFGQWLRRRRRACDLTQEELAAEVGCAVASLRKLESDERRPSKEMAQRIAGALGVPQADWPRFVAFARALRPVGSPAEPPPANEPAPRDAIANNLPAPLTSFVGREREILRVSQLLAGVRLLTLTGAGGSGKTRLALEVGRQLAAGGARTFPDGVWLVDLARLADANLLPQAIAAGLGLRDEAQRPLLDQLTEYLRPRRLLLLLDNCEHLIAACAAAADRLLRAAPGLTILATSREPLAIDGEVTFYVPSLQTPDPLHPPPLDALRGYEAVQLFTQRARAVKPAFDVTAENAPSVAEICARLDGMPLAIELAASRTKVLQVAEIRARLDDCFHLLTGGSRVALPRHQTLRATIEWSYALLADAEAALLRHLSVFAGGWTLDAAEFVFAPHLDGVDAPRVALLDLLTRLVDKSLVIPEWRGQPGRYGMLETLRQFAVEELDRHGEATAARSRHAQYFVLLAEEAEPKLMSREQRAWQERLEYEHNNIQIALDWLVSTEAAAERAQRGACRTEDALRLAGALWRYWEVRGNLGEAHIRLEPLLASPEPALSPAVLARAHLGAGVCCFIRGMFPQATAHYGASVDLYRAAGDARAVTRPLTYLAWMDTYRGEFARARAYGEEALEISRQVGDLQAEAWATARLGIVSFWAGDALKAVPFLERALDLSRELGDDLGTGWWLLMLGQATFYAGNPNQASRLLDECMARTRQLGDRRDYAYALETKAFIAVAQGQEAAALPFGREALLVFRELGDVFGAAGALLTYLLALRLSHPFLAIRLGSASFAVGSVGGFIAPLGMLAQCEECLAALRAAVGDEPFATAWQQGQGLPLDAAVAEALALGA
ncbi:MAG: tetratricopeptide repeat protein [Anaerolineae bacterium]|nr:tetratricopeptide repeat protein [Anaerolineae bacterium]